MLLCVSASAVAAPTILISPDTSYSTTTLTQVVTVLPPAISGYAQTGCLNTGSSVTILGSNFGSQKSAVLGGSGISVPLTVISWNSSQITAMIPSNPSIVAGQWYYIGIQDPKTGGWLSNIDKNITICAAATVSATINPAIKTTLSTQIVVPTQTPIATLPTSPLAPASPITPVSPTAPPSTAIPPKPREPAAPSKDGYGDYYGSGASGNDGSNGTSEPSTHSVLPGSQGSLMDRALPAPPPNLVAIQKQQKFLREHTEPEELVVISADMAQAQQLAQVLGAYGLTPKRRKPLNNLGLVISAFRVPPNIDLQQVTLQVREANPQMWVDLNHRYQLLGDSQSSRAAKNQITWPAQDNDCGQGLRIGMIDTELNSEHPALKGQNITSQSVVSAGINRPVTDHGTAVASLLIGKPGSEFSGLLPKAQLFSASVFRARDAKHTDTTAEWIINAIDWLLSQKVHTINMSLGGPRNLLLDVAIQRTIQSGVIVVAAVGNSGPNAPAVYPAAQPGVIAVTAIDSKHKPYRDAAIGDYISFAAPGVDVWAADAQNTSGKFFSGTSFATPFVSAAMAAQLGQKNKKISPRDAYTALEQSAKDLGPAGKDSQFGWGLVQGSCK
jgi:hypothetical protein